jgi:hypothetical protein
MKHPWYWSHFQHKLWAKQRENGELAFWKNNVFFWTIFMFVINGLFPMLFGFPYVAEKTIGQLLFSFGIWLIGGFLYGKFSWHFGEKLYHKYSD